MVGGEFCKVPLIRVGAPPTIQQVRPGLRLPWAVVKHESSRPCGSGVEGAMLGVVGGAAEACHNVGRDNVVVVGDKNGNVAATVAASPWVFADCKACGAVALEARPGIRA